MSGPFLRCERCERLAGMPSAPCEHCPDYRDRSSRISHEPVGNPAADPGDGHLRDRITWQRRIAWTDLPTAARIVALVLALFTDEHGQTAIYLTVADLERLTGLSQHSVKRWLGELEQLGWIARLGRGRGGPAARFLAWPGEAGMTPAMAEAAR